jgi:glycosyltransferase involved in cell wall biosynthesis
MIVPAVPTVLAVGEPPTLGEGFNVAVVNTWAPDEPLGAVLDAAAQVPQATFHVTGDDGPVARLDRPIPPNVRFTGFLAEPAYHGLLARADVVMCLTTRDHTMQNGAAEALYLGTPIITSDWRVLRDYFSKGTVHVDNSARSIALAVTEISARRGEYQAAIRVLRDERLAQWDRDRAAILTRVDEQVRRLRGGAHGGTPAGGLV